MGAALHKGTLIGSVIGPLVWAVHFLFVYVFLSVGCVLGLHAHRFAGINAINAVLLIGTAGFVAGLAYGAWRSYRRWRGGESRPYAEEATMDAPGGAFMDLLTTALYAISLLAVIWVTLPVLILDVPCR